MNHLGLDIEYAISRYLHKILNTHISVFERLDSEGASFHYLRILLVVTSS